MKTLSAVALSLMLFTMFSTGSASAVASRDRDHTDAVPADIADPSAPPCISWVNPVRKPWAALLCIHGLGLYSRAYQAFGSRLSRFGVAVYAIDVRGFGSWMKAEGHAEVDFDGCLQDIKVTLQAIRKTHPGLPVFVLGESMGGAIALRAASMYPELMNGLISSVPAEERFQQKKTDLKVAVEALRGPNRQFDIGSQIVQQASTAEVVNPETGKKEKIVNEKLMRDWSDDPLSRMNLSAKELIQFQRFMNDNHDSAKKVTALPVLFVQGMNDQLVRPDGTWELFKELATNDKTMIAVPSRHLIFEQAQDSNQDIKQVAYRMVLAWVISQLDDASNDTDPNVMFGSSTPETPPPLGNVARALIGQGGGRFQPQGLMPPQANGGTGAMGAGVPPQMRRRAGAQLGMRPGMAGKRALRRGGMPAVPAQPPQSCNLSPQEVTALTEGKPTVIIFYANWIDPSANLEALANRIQSQFSDNITLRKINASDAQNAGLMKAFEIGPLPTIVFLRPDGMISSTMIGAQANANVIAGITKMLLRQ